MIACLLSAIRTAGGEDPTMKVVFATLCLMGALGLSTLDASPPSTGEEAPVALAAAPPQLVEEAEPLGFCPIRWTCDSTRYYAMLAACESACGAGQCFREPFCQPGCICQ
jgi:hypothetical protein